MTEKTHSITETPKPKERQFKGLSLSERKAIRREKLIEAGIQAYGTHGFFAVTVKDICIQAKLTERYFYESFKNSEQLFQAVFLKLIDELQANIKQATTVHLGNSKDMIEASLSALLNTLYQNPHMARIIYIDALLVQELHQQSTLHDTMIRFDHMIHHFVMTALRHSDHSETEKALISSGLNGYVTQIAIRWVTNGFEQNQTDVLTACKTVFFALFDQFATD